MPHLQLESERFGTIALNGVFTTGAGVEATAGATGFGLPPVSIQWREGAGNGAKFRSKRLLSRDIDVPIYVASQDREALKAAMRQLTLVLRDEVTLRFVEDDGTSWYVKAHRSGGGDYVYGKDTTGEDDLMTVLTFRAGESFWTFSEETTRKVENPTIGRGLLNGSLTKMKVSNTDVIGEMVFENPGDADSPAVWKITGPGTDVQVRGEDGKGFTIPGPLLTDETFTIDTETGLVTDQDGDNRYTALGPAPRFWSIPPGHSTAQVSMDSPSPGTEGRTGRSRKNFAPNPSFELHSGGVAWYQLGTADTPPLINRTTTKHTGAGVASLKLTVPAGSQGYSSAAFQVFFLTVGQEYTVSCDVWVDVAAKENPFLLIPGQVAQEVKTRGAWKRISATFIAQGTSQFIVMNLTDYRVSTPTAWAVYWDNFYVGEPGGYFDGDFPREGKYEYEWDGTPDFSTSTQYELGILGKSSIEVSYRPRKHMVI